MHDAHAADALDEAVERAAVRALLGLLTPLDDLVRVRASVRARARARVRVRVRVRVGVGVRVRVGLRARVSVRVTIRIRVRVRVRASVRARAKARARARARFLTQSSTSEVPHSRRSRPLYCVSTSWCACGPAAQPRAAASGSSGSS